MGQLKSANPGLEVAEIEKLPNYVQKNKPRVAYFTRRQSAIDVINKQREEVKTAAAAESRINGGRINGGRMNGGIGDEEDVSEEQSYEQKIVEDRVGGGHSPISNDGMEEEENGDMNDADIDALNDSGKLRIENEPRDGNTGGIREKMKTMKMARISDFQGRKNFRSKYRF